jgi:hypothetical protein
MNPNTKTTMLFLGLSIDRQRKVTRRPSFCYGPAAMEKRM